jgi:phenazine biosynthesis protein phzE
MSTPDAPHSLLADAMGQQAWAVIRLRDSDTVTILGGGLVPTEKLADIPLVEGIPESGRRFDHLVAVPFRQIAERGFTAYDDGTPLAVMEVQVEHEIALPELIDALPERPSEFTDRGGFETNDDDYAVMVGQIIDDEIGNGEGANLVVGRHYRAQLDNWDEQAALSVLRRLLERERGAYWTYCFWTGDRFLIGASPERHVSVTKSQVRMNPISGTFRLRGLEPDERKQKLLEFLNDEKEIYELFMVVDEELKMMCEVCHEGGQVLGPFLKPMTHLVHTEYLLAGRSHSDTREILRDTMFAATVTGAPVENACRLIHEYEATGRGYYSGALALFGRDSEGEATLDSPIVIRTAEVSPAGELKVTAGATLVRDSDPYYEVAETTAKASGILSAFGLAEPAPAASEGIEELAHDEDVLIALGARNQRLARFWLTDQSGALPAPELQGLSIGILHGEDDFVNMLAHMFTVMGMRPMVVRHEDYRSDSFADADLVVVGPGPGDPRDRERPKIRQFHQAVQDLLASEKPFLSVCLGHQVLCDQLGIPLAYKDIVFQGTQAEVTLDQGPEQVGFYNTFVGRGTAADLPEGVTAFRDESTGDIHMVAGEHFRGIQFHAESILTENGYALLQRLILELVTGQEQ